MDFKDILKQLSERVVKLKDSIQTEEATKNALIMPFIQALGYDVFNPFEIVPEFTCDIGTKKGEKIDYAILKDGEPIILIECKHWTQNLTLHDNQLLRYFNVSKAKFGILTNGIVYKFYTDLEDINKMDSKPFMELNLFDVRDNQIEDLKKFHKSYFDIESILCSASDLKFTKELKSVILNEMSNPSEPLVRLLTKKIYTGTITAKVLEQFTDLTKRSFSQVISDQITDRLKTALGNETEIPSVSMDIKQADENSEMQSCERQVETTQIELEGFFIIRSMLRKQMDVNRIVYRDTLSYFGILLDDNNRKPICRLYFNGERKYIVTFDSERKEVKTPIETLDDLFNFEKELLNIIAVYDGAKNN